ncbi:MAG: lysophospholipid acyltransferase family protein [Pseudomonadota bacterium]
MRQATDTAAPLRPEGPIAERSEALFRFFAFIMTRQMRSAFRAIRILEPGLPQVPEHTPLMLYTNHPSWWDPAFFIVLSRMILPHRKAFGPMEAEALERYGFMRRIGVFGLDLETPRGAATFMRTATAILQQPKTCLWITAEGQFTDVRTRPVVLRPGASRVLARTPGALAVPTAFEYPFWKEKRPEALVGFGEPIAATQLPTDREAANQILSHALEETQDRLAAASMAQDATQFRALAAGRRGVGGVFALWQRLSALATGQAYRPDHSA